jgi:glutamate synthase (NADPH) large chain
MFLIDLEQGRIIDDAELKAPLAAEQPYQQWLDRPRSCSGPAGGVAAHAPDPPPCSTASRPSATPRRTCAFLMAPMAVTGQEAVGSMGNDNPLAVLSDRPKPLFNYFKQNFAQVTNPPIDPIREELVMSLVSLIGPRPNLLGLDERRPTCAPGGAAADPDQRGPGAHPRHRVPPAAPSAPAP